MWVVLGIVLIIVLLILFTTLEVTGRATSTSKVATSKTTAKIVNCPSDIYYPRSGENFPTVIVSPGAYGTKEEYSWVGQLLSAQGYVVLVYTPMGNRNDNLTARIECINKSLVYLENINSSKTLKGKVNINKIGVVGHSEGGGSSIITAVDSRVKVLVGLAPYTGGQITGQAISVFDSDKIKCPAVNISTLFIIGGKDVVLSSSDILSCFNEINTTKKSSVIFDTANHYSFCNGMVCWYKGKAITEPIKNTVLEWLNKNLK